MALPRSTMCVRSQVVVDQHDPGTERTNARGILKQMVVAREIDSRLVSDVRGSTLSSLSSPLAPTPSTSLERKIHRTWIEYIKM